MGKAVDYNATYDVQDETRTTTSRESGNRADCQLLICRGGRLSLGGEIMDSMAMGPVKR